MVGLPRLVVVSLAKERAAEAAHTARCLLRTSPHLIRALSSSVVQVGLLDPVLQAPQAELVVSVL